MRIRKRQVPLPLSSLSPIPLSGPLLFVPNNSSTKPSPPRIDPPEDLAPDRFPGGEKANNYHSRSAYGLVLSGLVDSRFFDCRGSDSAAEKAPAGSSPSSEAVKKGMLSSHEDDDDDDYDERDVKMKGSSSGNNGGKRRGRLGGGGTGAEGSRCSRVNGRGWRCGQQTLVGYSLCEHHLGKGRLRSVANVRGRSTISMTENPGNENEKPQQPHEPSPSPSPLPLSGTAFPGDIEEEDDEKEEDSTSTGPRKKARSMSSLLGQGSDQDASISLTLAMER